MQTQYIINKIQERSCRPIENPAALKRALAAKQTITFFNWECPPRTLSKTRSGQEYVDYNVDLQRIFSGKKIDAFTELPRVIELRDQEIATLKWLKSLGIRACFIKLIADTNAYYLTPESLKITGKLVIESGFAEFRELVQDKINDYPVPTTALLFTNVIKPYQKLYTATYKQAYDLLQHKPGMLVPMPIVAEQLERTRHHMGMSNPKQVRNFALKTIASYAAEGMVFLELTKSRTFSNCIWLNNHEIDERTIAITNCFRARKGAENLPMFFIR